MEDFRKRIIFDDLLIGMIKKNLTEEEFKRFRYLATKLDFPTMSQIVKKLVEDNCIQIKNFK
jgi:predicted transcriptional regulator